jgi:hypothetical protein
MLRYDHDLLLARTDYKPLDLGKNLFFSPSYEKLKCLYFSIYCTFSATFHQITFTVSELSITGKSFLKKRTRFFQKTSTWIHSTVALGWFLRSATSLQVSPFHEEKTSEDQRVSKRSVGYVVFGLLGGGRVL